MSPMPPSVQGPVDKVPCPFCQKPNDFRVNAELLETGARFGCDHCGRVMEISGVRTVKFVAVRPTAERAPVTAPAAPATTIDPRALVRRPR